MRKTSSLLLLSTLSVFCILCCAIVGFAQNREKFVISAKAGGINAITGQASVHSRGNSDWQVLSITDDLDAGDRVRTANDGRVEILLNPGSYLRLGGDSEVELSDNTLENLEVRLLRGTAIVEATGADDLDLNINISTPHTKLAIVRHGLYRLNVVPENATELIVRKGRVILSDSPHTKVKGGNKVVFNATNVSVAKLTKEEKKVNEDVDLWSKDRGKMLAKANNRINDRMLDSAFASFRDWDPYSRRLGFGVWFYNTQAHCYTFLPFYNSFGFGSPYGSTYTTSLYYPPAYYPYRYPTANTNGNPPQTGSNGGHTYPSGTAGTGGHTYPSGGSGGGGTSPRPEPRQPATPPSGGFGGGRERIPDQETGRPMPRKNLEPSRPDQ
jgi:hypothetical protein